MASRIDKIRAMKQSNKETNILITPTDDFDDFVLNTPQKTQDIVEKPEINESIPTNEIKVAESTKSEGNVSRETKNDIVSEEKNDTFQTKKQTKIDEIQNVNPFLNVEILNANDGNLQELKSYGVIIKDSCIYTYDYYAAVHDVKRYNLMNNIVVAEKEWLKDNPDFPSKDFVMSNVIKKNDSCGRSTKITFLLSADSKDFIKKMSKRCAMKMYEYVEYLIEKHLGDETL